MKDYIEERAIGIAGYIIDHNATVRQTAKAFGISKSTVHKDVTERLAQVNPALAKQARKQRQEKYWMSINPSVISAADWLPERSICTSTRYSMRQIILYGKVS
mgnify:CR=1 FL=1